MRKKKTNEGYKKGAASLYVVIFTTLLLGVITLGFIRIMISESRQTSEYDLSQSAYDSAMAGVEDAKTALLMYQDCLARGDTTSAICQRIGSLLADPNYTENCDIVRDMLDRGNTEGETPIVSDGGGTGDYMDQAYTCVRLNDMPKDYVSSLSTNNRVRMVPLRALNQAEVDSIVFSWFSDSNTAGNAVIPRFTTDNSISANNRAGLTNNTRLFCDVTADPSCVNNVPNPQEAPPVIELELIQTASAPNGTPMFTLDQLNTNENAMTNRGTLILVPGDSGIAYPGGMVDNTSNTGLAASADKGPNNPLPVKCEGARSPYRCQVRIKLPKPRIAGGSRDVRANETTYLRLSLPYGQPNADFSIEMLKANGTDVVPFFNVQSVVDSTGRANDLFRRVEARIEMSDVFYPFPEFTLTLTGDDETLNKNFWVTSDCWGTAGSATCKNSGKL